MFLLFRLVPFLGRYRLTPAHKGSDHSYLLVCEVMGREAHILVSVNFLSVYSLFIGNFTLPSAFLVNLIARKGMLLFYSYFLVNRMLPVRHHRPHNHREPSNRLGRNRCGRHGVPQKEKARARTIWKRKTEAVISRVRRATHFHKSTMTSFYQDVVII